MLYFVSPDVPGFGFRNLNLTKSSESNTGKLKATPLELESPFYRLVVDPATGGISSLIYKPTGSELVANGVNRALCQSVYYDGQEHLLAYDDFPWFREAPARAIFNVEAPHPGHFYWPDLDIDLGIASIRSPEDDPLIATDDPAA